METRTVRLTFELRLVVGRQRAGRAGPIERRTVSGLFVAQEEHQQREKQCADRADCEENAQKRSVN